MVITTKSQHVPFPLVLEMDESMTARKAWVKISQILTLAAERLTKKVGHAPSDVVDMTVEGLIE